MPPELKGDLALADLIRELAHAKVAREKQFAAIVRFVQHRDASGPAKDLMAQIRRDEKLCKLLVDYEDKSEIIVMMEFLVTLRPSRRTASPRNDEIVGCAMTSMRKTKKSTRYEDWRPFRTFQDLELPELPANILSAALELVEIKDDIAVAQLDERLRVAIRDYWVEHRAVVERPPAEWYRSKIEAIREAADNLLVLIREPTGTGLSQLRYETSRSMGRDLRGGGPECIERLLEDFGAACQRCTYPAHSGAIAHTHLRSTVAELAEIWIKYSNRPFARNFKTADNRRFKDGRPIPAAGHADAFTAPGSHFVQVMMQHKSTGNAMRFINSAGRIAWKATAKFRQYLVDLKRDAQGDLEDI